MRHIIIDETIDDRIMKLQAYKVSFPIVAFYERRRLTPQQKMVIERALEEDGCHHPR
jgi:hypothetical protein